MRIRDFEITKEMYEEARRIEDMENEIKKLDCRTEKFKKLNHKAIKAADKFSEKFTDEFDTLEIVNEYERREKNEGKKVIKKYIKHCFKKNKYHKIVNTKNYDALERQAVLCKKIAKDLKETNLNVGIALSELFQMMEWACDVQKVNELPFGYPDETGEWYFPTGRTFQNQEGNWFVEFEPEDEQEA